MCGQDKNFDVQLGPSQQPVHDLQGVGGAALAKPLPALRRQKNRSGAPCHRCQAEKVLEICIAQWKSKRVISYVSN
jgi:hypothetical protein